MEEIPKNKFSCNFSKKGYSVIIDGKSEHWTFQEFFTFKENEILISSIHICGKLNCNGKIYTQFLHPHSSSNETKSLYFVRKFYLSEKDNPIYKNQTFMDQCRIRVNVNITQNPIIEFSGDISALEYIEFDDTCKWTVLQNYKAIESTEEIPCSKDTSIYNNIKNNLF
jgi:hypothetical protein